MNHKTISGLESFYDDDKIKSPDIAEDKRTPNIHSEHSYTDSDAAPSAEVQEGIQSPGCSTSKPTKVRFLKQNVFLYLFILFDRLG